MIGTDSLASNHQLSVISEVNTILTNFPQIDTAVALSWATSGGADAFGWKDLGRFVKGCRPGGVLLKGSRGCFTAKRIF
jgi:cytosine/adenosine deaminase-related metal-dependent hydrolase